MKRLRRWAIVLLLSACSSKEETATPTDAGATDAPVATPDAGGTGGTLGAACTATADCSDGLTCVTGDESSDKVVKGLCTAPCTEDEDCKKFGTEMCRTLGSLGKHCLERCSVGEPKMTALVGALDPNKCHGRPEMACADTTGGGIIEAGGPREFCFPSCNDHAECPAGMKCRPGRGLCTTEAVGPYSEIGNPVDPDDTTTPGCTSGFRASINGVLFCSASCTLGVVPSCGWSGPGTKADAVCSITTGNSAGYGDSAKCSRMCDCDSDCPAPLRCHTSKAAIVTETGRSGVCLPGDTNLVPACGDAGVDAGDAGDAGDGG